MSAEVNKVASKRLVGKRPATAEGMEGWVNIERLAGYHPLRGSYVAFSGADGGGAAWRAN